MQIGNLKFAHPFFLAPMAGYTDLPFRLLCRRYGAALAYTEMISAAGLIRKHKKTLAMLKSTPEDKPLAVQLFGNDPKVLSEAAKIGVELGADIIDLNCGCPVKKVIKQGAGSALLQTPEQLTEIISAIVASVSVPVTVKLRTGWDVNSADIVELSQQLQSAGVKAIALHPRTAQQAYHGTADWTQIAKLKKNLEIPVIGSGDIKTGLDAINMLDETGCDAVLIARGALGAPWIFAEAINAYIPEEKIKLSIPKSLDEKVKIILDHLKAIVELYGEPHGVRLFRGYAQYYFRGWKDAAQLRNKINQLNTFQEVESLLAGMS